MIPKNPSKEQLARILKDPKLYLENFTQIKTKTGGLAPFVLKPAQKHFFNQLNKHERVIVLKARQMGFCCNPKQRVLTADLKWKTIDSLNVGDRLVGVDEYGERYTGRKMRETVVEEKWDVFEESLIFTMSNGATIEITPEHRMLTKKKGCTDTVWKHAKDLVVGDVFRSITDTWGDADYEDGWFSGVMDGEAYMAKKSRTGASIKTSQVDGEVWDRMVKYAEDNGYNYRVEVDDRRSSSNSKLGDKVVNNLVVSGLKDLFKLVGKTRPSRMRYDFWVDKKLPASGDSWISIVDIKKGKKQRMVDIQTSTSTFVLEGFVSHNSTAATGYLYHKTITTPGVNTALVGYNSAMTAELLDKVKVLMRTTPPELRPTVQYNSKYEISFPKIGSKILVLPSSDNVGRGYTLNFCLDGDTGVTMSDMQTKKIKDISIGDVVVNGNGGYSSVVATSKTKTKKEMYAISVYGSPDLNITQDHKVLVRAGKSGLPIWKEAQNITKSDYIAYPRYPYHDRKKTIEMQDTIADGYETRTVSSHNEIEVTPDVAEFFGWYIAEGSVSKNRLHLSIHTKELDYVLQICKSVEQYVGKISHSTKKGTSSTVVTLHGKNFANTVSSLFGRGAKNKFINSVCWEWGRERNIRLLKGIILGDGCLTNEREVRITTISERLANSVKRMIVTLRIGLPGIFINKNCERYGVKSQTRYDVYIGGKGNYKLRRLIGEELPVYGSKRASWRSENQPNVNQGGGYWKRGRDYYWAKVSNTKKIKTPEFVYDITLDSEPHSFLTSSGVVHNCLLTELAFWDKAEEKMNAIENAVPPKGGLIIVESTPNMIGNLYHRMWHQPDNAYEKLEYGWWWDYDDEEIELIRKRIGDPIRFAQEYELQFLSSGRPVFSQQMIKVAKKNALSVGDVHPVTGEKVEEVDGGVVIYKKPVPGNTYIVGADVAEGTPGGDFSVMVIFEKETGEEVAFWRGNMHPENFGEFLIKWGKIYNNALLIPEINNPGLATIGKIREQIYPNVYNRPTRLDGKSVPFGDKLGWRTTGTNKGYMIEQYQQALSKGEIIIRSKPILDEMLVFVYNDKDKMEALSGFHDDCIMASAVGYQGFKVVYIGDLEQIDYADHLPKSTSY